MSNHHRLQLATGQLIFISIEPSADGWAVTDIATATDREYPATFVSTQCSHGVMHPHRTESVALRCAKRTGALKLFLMVERQRYLHDKRSAPTRRRKLRQGKEWKQIRKQVLVEEPNCRNCGAPSVHVDHIEPLSLAGSQGRPPLEVLRGRANLQALCSACHAKKTRTDVLAANDRYDYLIDNQRPAPDVVTVEEIALNLGVKPATVRSWIRRGGFPARQIIISDRPDWIQAGWWAWKSVRSWADLMDRPAPDQPDLLPNGFSEDIPPSTGTPTWPYPYKGRTLPLQLW